MAAARWDETWHRLRDWTNGQGPSERLAAQVLISEGFTNLDPSHPLGGRDGGKDALCMRDGAKWAMAVHFPRGQQSLAATQAKFINDVAGAKANDVNGIAFVTNQELTLAQREMLAKAGGALEVELFHLERVTMILDQPSMAPVRKQFLGIESRDLVPIDKWVSVAYVDRNGLAKRLQAEGYRLIWIDAAHESERVELDGWEYVESVEPDSSRARLKIRDASADGGYLVLLKQKEA